jgi:hypothetical protein
LAIGKKIFLYFHVTVREQRFTASHLLSRKCNNVASHCDIITRHAIAKDFSTAGNDLLLQSYNKIDGL